MWSPPAASYLLDESEVETPQQKSKDLANLASTRENTNNEQKIGFRRQILVLSATQRDLYPLGNFVGSTEPCLLAESHIQLSEAYRTVPGHLRQVTAGNISYPVALGSLFLLNNWRPFTAPG